jgi:hypothetical protein
MVVKSFITLGPGLGIEPEIVFSLIFSLALPLSYVASPSLFRFEPYYSPFRYHSHRRRSHFTEDELRGRRALGSELSRPDPRRVVDEDLENRDIAAIASHRMDPLSGLSMHKISRWECYICTIGFFVSRVV